MCKSVTVSSLHAFQHSSSAWACFVPKLTSTLTVTEKILGITHVASLCHLLTTLEHGDAIGQPDHVVQILADVFVTCPTEPQSLPSPVEPGHQNQRIARCCPTMRKVFPLLHHADVSDFADRRIVLRRHHHNVLIYQELRAGFQLSLLVTLGETWLPSQPLLPGMATS